MSEHVVVRVAGTGAIHVTKAPLRQDLMTAKMKLLCMNGRSMENPQSKLEQKKNRKMKLWHICG